MAEQIKIYRWEYTKTGGDSVSGGRLQIDLAPHIIPFSSFTEYNTSTILEGTISSVEVGMVFKRGGSSTVSVDTRFSLSNSKGEIYRSDGWQTVNDITETSTNRRYFTMSNPPPINFFLAKDYTLTIEHRKASRTEIYSPENGFVSLRIIYSTPSGKFYIWENNDWTSLTPQVWDGSEWVVINPKVF